MRSRALSVIFWSFKNFLYSLLLSSGSSPKSKRLVKSLPLIFLVKSAISGVSFLTASDSPSILIVPASIAAANSLMLPISGTFSLKTVLNNSSLL